MNLYYTEKGEGPPLILLHGNGEDSGYFVHQLKAFADIRRVIAIDTRGHGKSPRGTAPFTIRQFAQDLFDFMEQHSIEKADILGFSDGGNTALIFALRYPQKVCRLILNGANLYGRGVKPMVQIPIIIGYKTASFFADKSSEAREKAQLLGLMVKDPDIKPEELESLRVKTLVITGTRDMIKDSHTKLIVDHIPQAKWRRVQGNHFIANRNPEAFNEAVREFLTAEDEARRE